MSDRKVYIDKMATQLKEWDNKIEQLEMKAKEAKASNKADIQHALDNIREKRDNVRQDLNKLRESGEAAWNELKFGLEKSGNMLADSIKLAMAKLKT